VVEPVEVPVVVVVDLADVEPVVDLALVLAVVGVVVVVVDLAVVLVVVVLADAVVAVVALEEQGNVFPVFGLEFQLAASTVIDCKLDMYDRGSDVAYEKHPCGIFMA